MTKRAVVLTFCDLAHDGEVEGETVSIAVEGARETHEVDLCEAHRVEVLGPLVAVARVVKRPGRKPAAKS